jgi:hypothetical protein
MSGRSTNSPAQKEETAMIDSDAVQRCEHVGERSFETVAAAFEAEFATLPSLPNLPARGRTHWIASKEFRLHPILLSRISPVASVVYAKPPFTGPEAVLAYLSRYTHRVAISIRRLLAFDETGVTSATKSIAAMARTASRS